MTYITKYKDTLPIRNVNGAHNMSNTPGTSHIRMKVKKQHAILIAMTDGI
jgi:hypothetical protein